MSATVWNWPKAPVDTLRLDVGCRGVRTIYAPRSRTQSDNKFTLSDFRAAHPRSGRPPGRSPAPTPGAARDARGGRGS